MDSWKPKHFAKTWDSLAKQVLPKDFYEKYGIYGLWQMDERILVTLDNLRKDLGKPITVNDWSWGGVYSQRGYRTEGFYNSRDAYMESRSDHKYGRAIDFQVTGMPANEVRKFIIQNKEKYPYITFLECGPCKGGREMTWVHISTRVDLDGSGLRCWSPQDKWLTEEEVLRRAL